MEAIKNIKKAKKNKKYFILCSTFSKSTVFLVALQWLSHLTHKFKLKL